MREFLGFRALRLRHLMVMLIALPLFISSAHDVFLNGQRVSAKAKTFSPSEPLPSQGKTIEIDITNKQYVPPNRTPKIPPDLKEQGVRFAVRAGDTIKICNKDKFFAKPFSLSKGNSFEGLAGPAGLRTGSCMSYAVQNRGPNAIRLNLADEIHARNKLFLVVLPANFPDEGEEDTPPDSRTFRDPSAEYPMTDTGEVDDDSAPKKITPPGKPEVEEIPEETVQIDQNWIGTWVGSYNHTVNISGGGDSMSASFQYQQVGASGNGQWSNCRVTGNTAECDYTAHHDDATKSGTRRGKLKVTLSGDTITATWYEDTPQWSYKGDRNANNVTSAMFKGAQFNMTFKRQ